MLLGPIATMADYIPVKPHPRIADLRRRAQLVTRNLRRVINYASSDETDGGRWASVEDEAGLQAVEERWLVSLQMMRRTQVELETGIATHSFLREVRRYASDMAPAIELVRVQAIEAIKQHRAFAAVMTGENDDEELGIDVLPSGADEPRPGRSVAIDW